MARMSGFDERPHAHPIWHRTRRPARRRETVRWACCYELLTGTTPFDKERLRAAALSEMVRLIKEEEAPRPSVRLSSSNNLPKIAAARKTEPARLSKLVRGEIDWIVMKCLEKDRSRRYDTASGLARDVER